MNFCFGVVLDLVSVFKVKVFTSKFTFGLNVHKIFPNANGCSARGLFGGGTGRKPEKLAFHGWSQYWIKDMIALKTHLARILTFFFVSSSCS